MKTTQTILLLCAGLFAGAAGAAGFSDDFESYARESLNKKSGWTVGNPSADQNVSVIAGSAAAGAGEQIAQFKDGDSKPNIGSLVLWRGYDDKDGGRIQFDLKLQSHAQNPSFYLRNGTTDAVKIMFASASVGRKVVYQNSAGTWIPVSSKPLTLGAWYRIEIIIAGDKFDIRILNGDQVAAEIKDAEFRTKVSSLNRIVFSTNSNPGASGADFSIDNLKIDPVSGS